MMPDSPSSNGSPDDAQLSETEELVLALVEVGVSLRKAEHLVDSYPHEKVRRQLKWLPRRPAKRPASLLIAAIENDYGPPAYS
jgi:hypothetical protein